MLVVTVGERRTIYVKVLQANGRGEKKLTIGVLGQSSG
jgi:hypothetical protein